MANQNEDHSGGRQNVRVKHVLRGGTNDLGRKTHGRQDQGPPANIIQGQMDRNDAIKR